MSKNSSIVIRQMGRDDVPVLVQLHAELFRGYDNTMMGDDYLRHLYEILACDSACISIVAHEGDEIVGWIGGVSDWPSFQRTLILRNTLGVPGILFSILKNKPRLLVKAFSSVRQAVAEFARRFKPPKVLSGKTSRPPSAALMVIGVKQRRQKEGIGQVMMDGFDQLVMSKDFSGISLTALANNEAGNRAFQKAGFVLYKTDETANYYWKAMTRETVH